MPRPPAESPLHLVQLSDLHLLERPGQGVDWCAACRGLDTDATLQAVLAEVGRREPRVDAVLVTGDIAQTPTAATYRRFRARLAALDAPLYCLPGNHDDPALLDAVLHGRRQPAPVVRELGAWRLLLLDSTCGVDQPHGELGPARRAALAAALAEAPARPTLVLLHHHPVPTGSRWLDAIGLRDGPLLLDLLQRHPAVRAVLCGHVHQALDRRVGGLRVLGAPSTCLQFAPASRRFRAADAPPGYRWLRLHPDGRLDTGLRWARAGALAVGS